MGFSGGADARPSDNTLLSAAAIGIFLVVVFSYLFPIDLSQISWYTSWLEFRYRVLPHWTDFWWMRWGIVAVLAAMVSRLARCIAPEGGRHENENECSLQPAGSMSCCSECSWRFAAVGGALLWLSPQGWSSYITMLDVRVWTPWKAVGLGILLMQSLMVVRMWPKRK